LSGISSGSCQSHTQAHPRKGRKYSKYEYRDEIKIEIRGKIKDRVQGRGKLATHTQIMSQLKTLLR
jgi:hypothetical protein